MTDSERDGFHLREPFIAARTAIEQPGLAGVPLSVDREPLVQLGVDLASYAKFAPGPPAPNETHAGVAIAVLARLSGMQLQSRDGFRVVRYFCGGTAVELAVLAARLTFANVLTPVVNSITGVPSSMFSESGDTASSLSGVIVAPNQVVELDWWIPPNRVFVALNSASNTIYTGQIEITQARI